MQTLSKIVVLFLLAFIFVVLGKYGTGHVVIFLWQYRVDLALSSLLLGIIISFVILYYILRFVANINKLPSRLKAARQRHLLLSCRKQLNLSAIDYFEGKFSASYKNAVESMKHEVNQENKFVALILAYKTSIYVGDAKKEQEILLRLNHYQDKKFELAKTMAIAQNQYVGKLYAKSLDNLNHVLLVDKKNILAHRLKLKIFIQLKNYDKAFEEFMWLTKNNGLDPQKMATEKFEILEKLFEVVGDSAELEYFYRKLSIEDKKNVVITRYYLLALLRLKRYDDLLHLFEDMQFNLLGVVDILIRVLSNLDDDKKLARVLNVLSKLQLATDSDWQVMLALGICNYKLKHYLLARDSLEKSLAIKQTRDGLVYLIFVASGLEDRVLREITEKKLLSHMLD